VHFDQRTGPHPGGNIRALWNWSTKIPSPAEAYVMAEAGVIGPAGMASGSAAVVQAAAFLALPTGQKAVSFLRRVRRARAATRTGHERRITSRDPLSVFLPRDRYHCRGRGVAGRSVFSPGESRFDCQVSRWCRRFHDGADQRRWRFEDPRSLE
jgi:hypothetical protein